MLFIYLLFTDCAEKTYRLLNKNRSVAVPCYRTDAAISGPCRKETAFLKNRVIGELRKIITAAYKTLKFSSLLIYVYKKKTKKYLCFDDLLTVYTYQYKYYRELVKQILYHICFKCFSQKITFRNYLKKCCVVHLLYINHRCHFYGCFFISWHRINPQLPHLQLNH